MKLAIYGRGIDKKDKETIQSFFAYLDSMDIAYALEENYFLHLRQLIDIPDPKLFSNTEQLLAHGTNYMISLGGDGTLLDTLAYVKNTPLPVLGINLGRLGFLSNIAKDKATEAVNSLLKGHYRIEKRSILELRADENYFGGLNIGLNDFTIHKRDTGSMISIQTFLNGEYFNTYWADGLIVSTPTGSTAYSLSCGGPIIFPDSNNFVITPVAPHNLNIRPIIVSDSTVISFRVQGRGTNHLISLDSRYEIIEYSKEIAVQKAPFFFNLVKPNNQNFINTLRDKLSWGLDTRNL